MGSLERKLKRNQIKLAYKEFSRQFNTRKTLQREQIKSGLKVDSKELLVKKPSIGLFIDRVKKYQEDETAKRKSTEERRIAEVDLEWKDD